MTRRFVVDGPADELLASDGLTRTGSASGSGVSSPGGRTGTGLAVGSNTGGVSAARLLTATIKPAGGALGARSLYATSCSGVI